MIRLFFIISVLFTISLNLDAQNTDEAGVKVKWYTMQEALVLNKKKPKKIFIDVYTNWCGWCKVMDRNTFANPVIAEYMNENYYPVKFNAESYDTIQYAGQTFVNSGTGRRATHDFAIAILQGRLGYPSIVFMDEKNKLIIKKAGYHPPEKLEPLLAYYTENAYKKSTIEEFRKTFKSKL